ncbi:MAG: outer membrane protein assembly factor BamA [Deltaproteobacteria bacterium]|nr:MAG: outer membrane protein assembly factor BamA [Deltaproteobacteria bacterium]
MDDFSNHTVCAGLRVSHGSGGWGALLLRCVLLLLVVLAPNVVPGFVRAQEAAQKPPVYVDSVQVEGNQRIEKEAILAVVKTRKGDLFDQDQLDQDLRDIYRMKYFTDVRIELKEGEKGKIVVFRVKEKPSIGEVVFKGNRKMKEADLKEEAAIKLYSVLDDNEIKQSINRLLAYYRQKGYYNAEIRSKIEPLPKNQVRLKYIIVEGKKVYISKIDFVGNTRFDDDELRDLMETREKGFFSWITDSGYLDRKKLEFDVHKITAFYQNHGFIKARVGAPKIVFDKNEMLKIIIEIEEGPQYGVNRVSVDGDLIEPADVLLRKVRIGTQTVFNREVVRDDINALRDLYVDRGYAYAEVVPRTREDDLKHVVDICYHITKGPKVRFERINITGNTITRDKVIRRELKAIEAGDFSGEAMRKSKENLDRLGFFEDVKMETRKGSRDDQMILDVKVRERPTGSFSVGAGYSSEDAIFGMFQISQSNLFGKGQKLQASARLGGLSTQFTLNFTEPWLFDTHYSGNIELYKWKQEYDDYTYEGEDYDDYTRNSYGIRLGLGYPIDRIDEFTRGSVQYGYDNSDISNIPDTASPAWKDMEGKNITSSLTFGVRRDSRDKPWDTHKGSQNSLSLEVAGGLLGGDVGFYKFRASSAWYFPLVWNTVFLARGNWGYIKKKPGEKLPVFQKFRIGGINSVRGFDYGDISPRDINGEYVGGEKMMYYTLEYRVPILKKQGIVGLVFFDCGNVFEKGESYTFSGIKRSAGGGIRWYSPMGPLRLEYGKNLNPKEDEKSGKWEFSVGGVF